MYNRAAVLTCCVVLSACASKAVAPPPGHVHQAAPAQSAIPEPVLRTPSLSPPAPAVKAQTYSVTVYRVPVQSVLFALARDARIDLDVHPGIEGEVTLNALDQTLPQLLSRISKQVEIRYTLSGKNLIVMPDTPFLRTYKVDYVNVARSTTSKVSIATQISTPGAAGGAAGGDNNSTTTVTNASTNNFWEQLEKNVRDILREADRKLGAARPATAEQRPAPADEHATPAKAAPPALAPEPARSQQTPDTEAAAVVISNPGNGLLAVRATARQHEKVQEFLDMMLSSAKRQVLVEATVVEVQLNDNYQQGINWASLRQGTEGANVMIGAPGLPSGVYPGAAPDGMLTINYANPASLLGNLAASLKLLESFGKVKVLSSPKISVLNNQTATLKVVDNRVYFTISSSATTGSLTSPTVVTYTSELHTVPVGFVMSLTPQIADNGEVTLNVRPSISRIVNFVDDPNPALSMGSAQVRSRVPEIQTREMESILKVSSGQVAVMGGLMQDSVNNLKDEIPLIGRIPFLGKLTSARNETSTKSELVIFMRPVVIKDASIDGDYKDYRYLLPKETNNDRAARHGQAPASEGVLSAVEES
jgi:general secretion pathway protein D